MQKRTGKTHSRASTQAQCYHKHPLGFTSCKEGMRETGSMATATSRMLVDANMMMGRGAAGRVGTTTQAMSSTKLTCCTSVTGSRRLGAAVPSCATVMSSFSGAGGTGGGRRHAAPAAQSCPTAVLYSTLIYFVATGKIEGGPEATRACPCCSCRSTAGHRREKQVRCGPCGAHTCNQTRGVRYRTDEGDFVLSRAFSLILSAPTVSYQGIANLTQCTQGTHTQMRGNCFYVLNCANHTEVCVNVRCVCA